MPDSIADHQSEPWDLISPDPPLERPAVQSGPRVHALFHVTSTGPQQSVSSTSHAHTRRAFPSVSDLSGSSALSRPAALPSRSSGPERSVHFSKSSALQRPDMPVHSSVSPTLPRELPPGPSVEHVGSSSHVLHSWQDQNQRTSAFSRILKPETFLHSSKRKANQPKSIPKPSKTQSRAQRCSDSHLVRQILPLFLSVYASCSTLLQDLSSSEFADAHLLRILDGFAPSTVFKYLSALISFANTVHWLHFSVLDLTEITLADALHAHSSELGKFSQMTLKAIRWSWKNLQLSCFSSSTSSLINSFTKEIVIRDRRESLIFPLIVLIQWERRILMSQASVLEIIVLGSLLLMTFSGMRFGDLQRMMVQTMQYDGLTLRGLSWRTKTCVHGVPWGIHCGGFLSVGSHHWVHKYLTTLDSILVNHNPNSIDYLIPSMAEEGPRTPLTAMSYLEALYFVRRYLELPWRTQKLNFADVSHYTVHGLKSTFISWASQLGISPELRRLQGKHKDPMQSTRLYSRDDVDGSLKLQREIVSHVQKGWKPHTPLGRGGQMPLTEPQFQIALYNKTAAEYQWRFFTFSDPSQQILFAEEFPEVHPDSDSSSSVESGSSDPSSSGVEEAPKKSQARQTPFESYDEAEVGTYRSTWHILARVAPTAKPDLPLIGTACGRKFPQELFFVRDQFELP